MKKQTKFSWLVEYVKAPGNACRAWPFLPNKKEIVEKRPYLGGTPVSRAALVLYSDRDPAGLVAAHSCTNTWCINPRHMRWAPETANHADEVGRSVPARGRRLTEDDKAQINEALAAGVPVCEIARSNGVARITVRDMRAMQLNGGQRPRRGAPA